MTSQHDYATATYLPSVGSRPEVEEIVDELSPDEVSEVADYADLNSTGMYDGGHVSRALNNLMEDGEIVVTLVDEEDVRENVMGAGLDGRRDLERFLYSAVGDRGEFTFYGEGEYKRIFHDRDRETTLVQGKEDNYSEEGQRNLLESVNQNIEHLRNARSVRPPSERETEIFEYEGRPLMEYGFNDEMVPLHQLDEGEREEIRDLVEEAEREMMIMIDSEEFETVQRGDFQFATGPERAESHLAVPADAELGELDEVIVTDLGEIEIDFERTFAI